MAHDKDNKLEQQEEEGGESVSVTLAAGASGGMISMNSTNQEEGVECVHNQESKNDERKSHNEPVSGMTSGCSGGMSTMSSADRRGFGRAHALQQRQESGHGSVLVGPPSAREFGRGHGLLHRHVRNEDPPNQHPNPDHVSDHELIPFDPASMGTDVTGDLGRMLTLMSQRGQFGQEYGLLHQRVFNNAVNNANKNGPGRRNKEK